MNFSYPEKVSGMKQRLRGAKFNEHFNQAQLFYNSLTPIEKQHLVNAISFELSHCDDPIVFESYTKILNNVDFELAKQVAINVGGVVPETPAKTNHGKKSSPLSQVYYAPKTPTIKSRRIAILIADGFDLAQVEALRAAFKAGMANSFVIGPRRGWIYPAGVEPDPTGRSKAKGAVWADHHFEGQRSTLFDATVIPGGTKSAQTLASNGRTIHWIREAFGHCKAIGGIGEGEFPVLLSTARTDGRV